MSTVIRFEMTKDLFFRVYANLPEDLRKEIVLVINQKPYTWNAILVEVSNETKLGNEMLIKLKELGIL